MEEPHKENGETPLDSRENTSCTVVTVRYHQLFRVTLNEVCAASVSPLSVGSCGGRESPRQDFNEHFSADVRCKYNTPSPRSEGALWSSRSLLHPLSLPLIHLTSRRSPLSSNSICGSLNAAPFVIIHTSKRMARRTSRCAMTRPSEIYYRELYMAAL